MGAGVLSAIGQTPLVRLCRIFPESGIDLYAKLEGCNPGGSIKDRAAYSIIKRALETGEICPDTVVIESSSGNMGIGLAQACAYYGLRFICVIDPKTTSLNVKILQAYGAEVDLVSTPDPESGEFLQARIKRVKLLLTSLDHSFWPNQYGNQYNAYAHYLTMHEIVTQLNGKVDYLFCTTSTCGTLRGCAEYVRLHNLPTKIVAIDAVGSIIFGGRKAKRLIPGHGAAVCPPLYQDKLADDVIYVSDLECVMGCRGLIQQEAILAGGSSGAVLMGFNKYHAAISAHTNCVLIFADRGERYLDTIYSDPWVLEHFGAIPRFRPALPHLSQTT